MRASAIAKIAEPSGTRRYDVLFRTTAPGITGLAANNSISAYTTPMMYYIRLLLLIFRNMGSFWRNLGLFIYIHILDEMRYRPGAEN